jgi:prepilin peptidase CpaA
MVMHDVLVFAPALLLTAIAAVIDWRSRRIPNWLNLLLLAAGLVQSWQAGGSVSLSMSLLGAVVGFFLLLPAFALGAMGGGDVKLLTAIGAWTGPVGVVGVLVIATVIGGVVAVAQAAQSGKLAALLKNSAVLSLNLVHARRFGADHIRQTGQSFASIDRPLPYAVPLLAGLLGWVAMLAAS